jgi:hypothetical protein
LYRDFADPAAILDRERFRFHPSLQSRKPSSSIMEQEADELVARSSAVVVYI